MLKEKFPVLQQDVSEIDWIMNLTVYRHEVPEAPLFEVGLYVVPIIVKELEYQETFFKNPGQAVTLLIRKHFPV